MDGVEHCVLYSFRNYLGRKNIATKHTIGGRSYLFLEVDFSAAYKMTQERHDLEGTNDLTDLSL